MDYLAHLKYEDSGRRREQTVQAHCRACAFYARSAAPEQLKKLSFLAGLLHDMGKFTKKFNTYLEAAVRGEAVRRGSVNHTFAAVRFIMERWHVDEGRTLRNLAAELLMFAVGSHHGQFDCVSPAGKDGYLHRLEAEGTDYGEALEQYLLQCAGLQELDGLFEEAVKEITDIQGILRPCAKNPEEILFYYGFLARMVLSCVIEGDRRDTAEFQNNRPFGEEAPPTDWKQYLKRMEEQLAALPGKEPINQKRRQISDICRSAASQHGGIFRLNVPTGGGKTLASLRFALARAGLLKKKRLFFVIPLLSILEQNADVIHTYIQDDDIILEHHSNVLLETPEEGGEEEKLLDRELLLETWRSPIVITTLVQLLNTLFEGKPSCIRRLSALCDSVLIIDEIQSLPRHMLSQFNLAINVLAHVCGTTVVLCSATQPCLEKANHAVRPAPQPDLVPYDWEIWKEFQRTSIKDLRKTGGYTIEELAGFTCECQLKNTSVLVICNTKKEAWALYKAVKSQYAGALYHLSTAMCMEHRKQAINSMKKLPKSVPHVCIATQLVEAGVDISFGSVIRIFAGMDNAVQAAGRCNRSGEFGRICPVYLVNFREEVLRNLPEIEQAQRAAESMLLRYHQNPEQFQSDPAGEEAIRAYYSDLYGNMNPDGQDYPLKGLPSLFELLSRNENSCGLCPTAGRYFLCQAFETAGEQFRVFDDNTVDVLVPFGDGEELIAALASESSFWGFEQRRAFLRKAASYTVPLYEYELKKLQNALGVYSFDDGKILVLQPNFYSKETGFVPEGDVPIFLEVNDDV